MVEVPIVNPEDYDQQRLGRTTVLLKRNLELTGICGSDFVPHQRAVPPQIRHESPAGEPADTPSIETQQLGADVAKDEEFVDPFLMRNL